jgi:prophage tail gpP-like protein
MRIVIDKKNVDHFTAGSITLKLDSIASTFEFSSRFSANKKEHQEMFKPLQYKEVQIFNSKNKLIFTGTLLNHRFKSNKGRELIIVSGYSKSGILEDVEIPASAYPLESTNLSLLDISNKLCGLFGINVVLSEQGKSITDIVIKGKVKSKRAANTKSTYEDLKAKATSVFGRTSASPTETIKDYLAKLARQKNIVL